LGHALLHEQGSPPDLSDEAIIVEGTFDVWVPLEASPHIVYVLEGCAERVQRDQVSRYRLTREALHQALKRGQDLDRLLELLDRYGRGEVPQNVAFTLREWATAYGRLRLERLLLLLADDEALLEQVLADAQVQEACGERLSPTAVEVDRSQVAALIEMLCRLGFMPRTDPSILPPTKPLSLQVTPGQATELLALLWAFQEETGSKGKDKALAQLADSLTGLLPPDRKARAHRRKTRLRQLWQPDPDGR
jgi:hypothetical protein